MRTKFELFAAVLLLLSASNLFAQTTFNWTLNNSGEWDLGLHWTAVGGPGGPGGPGAGAFPGINDTAVFGNITSVPPIAENVQVTIPVTQGVRNVTFSSTETNFTIGPPFPGSPATTTLNVGSSGQPATILRSGSRNATIASNIVMGSNLLVNNTNNTVPGRSLTLTNLSTGGVANTVTFNGVGTTNLSTINGGGNATFASTGTVNVANLSTLNTVSFNGGTNNVTTGITNVSTITATGGTNTITSVSGTSTIDLNGGTNLITSVTGGVVNVNGGTNSLTNATGTQVNLNGALGSNLALGGAGATLRGTGTVNGNVILNSGANYSPGNSPGVQTIAGDLTFNTGSSFTWELDGNTTNLSNYDRVLFSGANRLLTVNPNVNTNLVFTNVDFNDAFWDTNQTWQVFSNVGLVGSLANFNILGGGGAQGTFQWQLSGSNINLQFITAVPEPSSLALVVLLGGVLGFSRRRMAR